MKHLLFPSFIYQAPLKPRLKSLLTEISTESEQIRLSDHQGQAWSKKNYPGGYTSYGSLDQLYRFSSTFELLRKEIDRHVQSFVKTLEMDISAKELQMSTCWLNIMPRGAVHSMHIHPLSVISGSFYVRTPKKSSAIKFEDPRLVHFMASPPRKKKAHRDHQRFVEIQPSAGEVILFESWMKHEVPTNPSQEERISISFNYDWTQR